MSPLNIFSPVSPGGGEGLGDVPSFPNEKISRCVFKSLSTLADGSGGPKEFLVAGVVLSRTNLSYRRQLSANTRQCISFAHHLLL